MKRFACALALLAALRLLLMAFVPVFEPSEARYAAIAANMARDGDFVVPHFTYDGRYQSFDGKPPLVFQAGGLAVRALGAKHPVALQFAVRIFPFVSAALLLAIVHFATKRLQDAETARLAVLVTATSTAFYAAAGLAMTDMTLTCAVAGALALYACFAETPSFPLAAATAALLGAGMLVKGPVALVLFGLPVALDATFRRRWRRVFDIRWLAALPVFLLVAVPWFVLVERRNPGSVWYFFYHENFLRFVTHDYGDKYGAGREAFRGVSILWAFVATLPWALLPLARALLAVRARLPAFRAAPRAACRRLWSDAVRRVRASSALAKFSLAAVVAMVGFWCLTSRVLLYYLFPMIPLFAMGLAASAPRALLKRCAPWCLAITAVVAVGALAGGALFSDKMKGARAEDTLGYFNGYAHEFYHGTNPRALGEGVDFKTFMRERYAK